MLSLMAQMSNLLAFLVVYWFDFQHLHLAQIQPEVSRYKKNLLTQRKIGGVVMQKERKRLKFMPDIKLYNS